MSKDKKRKPEPVPESPVAWRLGAGWVTALAVAWLAALAFLYYRAEPPDPASLGMMVSQTADAGLFHPYAARALLAVLLAAAIAWAGAGAGALAADRLLPAGSLHRGERLVFGAGLGFGLLSLAVFLLGAARLWYPAVFWTLLAAAGAAALRLRPAPPAPEQPPSPAGPWYGAWIGCLVLFFAVLLAGCLMPEVFYDSLFYHLGLPNLYRLAHRLYPVPVVFDTSIMAAQMVWGFAFTIGDTLTAKLLHGATALLLAAAYVAFGRRYLSRGAGALAAVLYLTMPVVTYSMTRAGIEGPWNALQFLSAYALVRALERGERGWLVTAGLLTGLSASCKFQGFPFVPIACVVFAWTRRREDGKAWSEVVRELLWFVLPAAAMVLPYVLRNVLFHGNPVYPFLGTKLGWPRIPPDKWRILMRDATQRIPWTHYFLHPWYVAIEHAASAGTMGPSFLLFFPLLFLGRVRSRACRVLLRYFALAWGMWLATSPGTVRYGLPALTLLAPVLAELLLAAARGVWGRLLLAGALAAALSNLMLGSIVVYMADGWKVLGGLESEDAYLGSQVQTYPAPPYDAIAWMNKNLSKGSKVLFVGEPRTYYTRVSAIPASVYDVQPILAAVRASSDAPGLARELRREGVTHVFVNLAETFRTATDYELLHFEPAEWARLAEFWTRYVKLDWREENLKPGDVKALYVYEVLSDEEAAKPHPPAPNPFGAWAPGAPPIPRPGEAQVRRGS